MSSVATARPISSVAERNNFVRRNQGLVCFFAKKYLGRGLSLADLMQEGNIGLSRAIRGFDPARGYEFSTYAGRCIRNAISSAIRTNSRHHKESISLNEPIFHDELNGPSLIDRLPVTEPDQEIITDLKDALPRLLTVLSPPETRVLELTLIEGMSLVEAGKIMGVSRERSRQLQADAFQKMQEMDAGSRAVIPYINWLKDEGAVALMSKALNPEEKMLLEITFIRWVSRAKAASLLGVSPAEITKLRNILYRKLNDMYDIIQSVGVQNIKSANELSALARLAGLKKRIDSGKETVPRDKTDLCRKLGICKFTLRSWQNASETVKRAVAELVSIGKKNTWRLHPHEQLPAEKRTPLFAHGYNRLATPERDLGREPIAIAEIASAINYDVGTLMRWIIASPEMIGPNAILYLKSFSLPKTFTLELRRRRIIWALNFARENGFKYLNPAEFAKERLNITRLALRNWMLEYPEVANIFAGYRDIIGKQRLAA